MPSDIALLRRLAAGRETSQDRAALAKRVRTYLDAAPAGATLDEVFGLARAPGGVSWWHTEALTMRDAALRALAARFYGGRSQRGRAKAIRAALAAYAASSWRFDQGESGLPASCIGTEREMLFDVLKARAVVPSADRIRQVIGGG